MNRPRMTSAATALHRQLVQRAAPDTHRIFLSSWISSDWHSLTFAGERHQASYVFSGPDAADQVSRWQAGLEEAEFAIPNGFLAEISLTGRPQLREDGAIMVELEALTLAD